jgi:TPR repeat protein
MVERGGGCQRWRGGGGGCRIGSGVGMWEDEGMMMRRVVLVMAMMGALAGGAWGEDITAKEASALVAKGRALVEKGQDQKAVAAFEEAMRMGSSDAMIEMGLLAMAEKGGIEKGPSAARRWFEKAAAKGNGVAMNDIGRMYQEGIGVDPSPADAAKWYQRGADTGNATAMNNLGMMYLDGQGVEQSDAEAFKWFKKAAEAGDAQAMNNTGLAYRLGKGVEKNDVEAGKWFKKSADAGLVEGMLNLGIAHEEGKGVPQSMADAMMWYRKAAELGNSEAMYDIGIIYAEGKNGVVKDPLRAMNWMQKGAILGEKRCLKWVAEHPDK